MGGQQKFTFYELESLLRQLIRSLGCGKPAKEIVRASNTAAVLIFRDLLLGGKTPLQNRQNAFLDSHPFWKGKKPNTKKGGRRVIPPLPTHNFGMHSSPHLPNKEATGRCHWVTTHYIQQNDDDKCTHFAVRIDGNCDAAVLYRAHRLMEEVHCFHKSH